MECTEGELLAVRMWAKWALSRSGGLVLLRTPHHYARPALEQLQLDEREPFAAIAGELRKAIMTLPEHDLVLLNEWVQERLRARPF